MFVYIRNCHGQPLMPCQPRKARLLLKEGKAKVVRMVPFTLQLLYGSSGYKQEVSLGIDAGSQHIAFLPRLSRWCSLKQKCSRELTSGNCLRPAVSSAVPGAAERPA